MQQAGVEVDEQADLHFCNPQIGKKLRFKDGVKPLNALQLQDYRLFNNEIEPMLANDITPIHDRNGHLPLERYPGKIQLNSQGRLIDGFEKPGSKLAMHLNRTTDNLLGQFIVFCQFFVFLLSVPLCLRG